jgi:hypothetical protein
MPNLGDYFGHLLSELTIARIQSDLEASRVADLYASNPLLKHFPVPRFRLPAVTLDVPVVIQEIEEPEDGKAPRGDIDFANIHKTFKRVFEYNLKKASIKLEETLDKNIERGISQTISKTKKIPYISVTIKKVVDDLVSTTLKVLKENKEEIDETKLKRFEMLSNTFRDELIAECIMLRQPPPRLKALVTTSELKEAGPPELLAKFHLSVSEEAVEWTTIESDGKTSDRLVPE